MSVDELRGKLAQVLEDVATARRHADQAQHLLEEAQQAITRPQSHAEPWLPEPFALAVEHIGGDDERLGTVQDLLNRYQSRL